MTGCTTGAVNLLVEAHELLHHQAREVLRARLLSVGGSITVGSVALTRTSPGVATALANLERALPGTIGTVPLLPMPGQLRRVVALVTDPRTAAEMLRNMSSSQRDIVPWSSVTPSVRRAFR